MFCGQTEKTKKPQYGKVLVLALLILCMTAGGVSAYLSMSSGATSNAFDVATQPEVIVSGTTVTVNPNGYAVYLRVAVDVDLVKDGLIHPEEPWIWLNNTNNEWETDGRFYYYTTPIMSNTSLTVPVFAQAKDGYELTFHVAAQVVQAVGTDDDGVNAVKKAWGVDFPEATVSNGNS